MDHPAQMKSLRMTLDSIQARNHEEMSVMAGKYQSNEDIYKNTIEAMAEKQQDTENRHQRELGDLKYFLQTELKSMKRHLDNEMTAMAEKRWETEDQHQAQLNNLRETHRRQYKDQHDNYEEEKTELSKAHKEEFFRYRSEMEAALSTKQYEINTIEARIQKLEQDNLELEGSFKNERVQVLNLQATCDELSAMRKADKQKFISAMEAEILRLEQDGLNLRRHLDEEHTQHVRWKVKYHELSAMKRADEQQTFDITAHPKVESETSISPKIDRDAPEVQTEIKTQEVMKEGKPSDGQASSLARGPSGQNTREERRRSKEAPKNEKPTAGQSSSLARSRSKLDMEDERRFSKEAPKDEKPTVGQSSSSLARIRKWNIEMKRRRRKRDVIEEEMLTVGQP